MHQAATLYLEVARLCAAIPNVWRELEVLKRVIGLSQSTDEDLQKIQTRIREILSNMAKNAQTVPVKGMFLRFRRKWDKL